MSNVKMFCDALPNIPWQEKPADVTAPVWRYNANPIIDRNPVEGVARIFNSAVVPYEGKFIGVFRGEQVDGIPYIYLGRSEDAKAAIEEARAGKNLKKVDTSSFENFIKSCSE